MAKVFRLYDGGADTYTGWNGSPAFPYNQTARNTIKDPNGASARHEITSIPSPFARIDLVKTAFREVCRLATQDIKTLDDNTIYHKMVSDSLDVAEIFFRIDNLSSKIEIITCDIRQMIADLHNDGIEEHPIVANALDKYFKSDAKNYNFDKLKNIYLLNYINGPEELNIIGATSPATLFFCGANDLSYVDDVFFVNNDKPFDSEFQPLYKRDVDFIKAFWTFKKQIPDFASLFPEVDEYLSLTYRAVDLNTKQQLQKVEASYASNFNNISVVVGQQSNFVEILGTPIFKKKAIVPGDNSGFTIQADYTIEGPKPLVLPTESGNQYANLFYVGGLWGTEYKAPYHDGVEEIANRQLPYEGSRYPYLTISDFLEDNLVKVPHALDTKHYFDGKIEGVERKTSYLLPIKPLYFKYFTVESLTSQMLDGRNAFEMEKLAGGSVHVTLRIPVTGSSQVQYIEYQRTYYAERQADISATTNSGGIKSFNFAGMVMPSVKFSNEAEALFKVACVTPFTSKLVFEFYKKGHIIHDIPCDCRNTNRGVYDYKAETYTVEKTNFDVIRVVDPQGISGLLVPNFLEHTGVEDFDFAVDLGTSNTHIEFKKRDEHQSQPLNYKDTDNICSRFFVPTYREIEGEWHQEDLQREHDLLEADYAPAAVGENSEFYFPSRTVLSCAKTTNWSKAQRVFGMVNFNLTYNKRAALAYNTKPMVNIKWSRDDNAQAAMNIFIENLLMLIRNKVVACNGNLHNTRITWFYPNSMSIKRRGELRDAWNDAYERLFNNAGTTDSLSESVAPIKYYFGRYSTATDLVNVDIGGGTTDIAFSSGGKVQYITSFKLAANSLFEDTFSLINPNNGIIDSFKDDMYRLLEDASNHDANNNKLRDLLTIYNSNIGQPANMASFLFSLKDNPATKEINPRMIDFNKVLQSDDQFKIVFILFYTAIVYHIAQVVKTKGLKAPRHIAFSGNGSRILTILASDPKVLSQYTKIVFEKVLGKPLDQRLEILGLEKDARPKEATCKGGLIAEGSSDDEPEKIVLRDSSGAIASESDTYATLDGDRKKQIVESVEEFFRFALEEMPKAIKLDDYFGVDKKSIDIARDECKNDLESFLERGIVLSVKESGEQNNPIEDSLSFYLIKGVLTAIETRIQEYKNENH